MFGVGFTEILAIGVIALLVIGPKDLPRLAQQLGRFINDMKRGRDEFVNQLHKANPLDEVYRAQNELEQSLKADPKSDEPKT